MPTLLYLPAKLADRDDQDWEIVSSGKPASLMTSSNAASQVFMQEKNTSKARIVIHADGHIEYRKE